MLGPVRYFRSGLACTIIAQIFLLSSPALAQKSSGQAERDKQILEACRSALVDLKFTQEKAALLEKQIEELKKVNGAQAQQVAHLNEAIVKYESAITARTQAETLVYELRANYQQQLALAEKQLAIEQGKTTFWRTMAKVGLFVGVLVGGVFGYALGNK